MAKVNAHSDEALNIIKASNVTAPIVMYLGLLTTMTDPRDPATWVEAAYAGYARVALNQATDFTGPAAHTTGRKLTWPASGNKDFAAVPAGGATIVGWALIAHDSLALATYAKRAVDTAFSKVYAQNDVPRCAQNSMTTSEQ